MKEIRLAYKIFKTLIKDNFQYPGRVVVDTVALLARCGLLLTLYYYVFQLKGGVVNGVTFQLIAWSMFFYFAFSVLRLRHLSTLMMRDIQSGTIEVLLSKPISYLTYRMWWQIGAGLYSFLVITLGATIAMILIVGIPSTMTIGIFIPTLLLTFVLGAILALCLYSIVGLFAFWIEDINPVFWIVDKSVMILGGSYLPIALFPDFMYKIAIYSPFGASQFVSHTVYTSWQTNWAQLVGIQIFWILVLGIIAFFMFGQAQKKVSVNGG